MIDEAGRSLTSRSRFLSLVPFRPEERRNGWEEREALASLTPPCGANDMRPEWAKRERNVSEPFRRLSPLSARFLSSRSFHSLPEDVRAEERGEGQTTVGNEWEEAERKGHETRTEPDEVTREVKWENERFRPGSGPVAEGRG